MMTLFSWNTVLRFSVTENFLTGVSKNLDRIFENINFAEYIYSRLPI